MVVNVRDTGFRFVAKADRDGNSVRLGFVLGVARVHYDGAYASRRSSSAVLGADCFYAIAVCANFAQPWRMAVGERQADRFLWSVQYLDTGLCKLVGAGADEGVSLVLEHFDDVGVRGEQGEQEQFHGFSLPVHLGK